MGSYTLAQASQLSIYNMSLAHLPVAGIQTITDTSNAGNACNAFWNSAVAETLRAAPWDFNTVYITLAQNTTYQLITNWAYAYTYPQNCVKLWRVMAPISGTSIVGTFPGIYPNTSVNSWNGWNMQRQKYELTYDPVNDATIIMTNVSPGCIAKYSINLIDPAIFDWTFVRCLSFRLAAYICPPLINDSSKAEALLKLAGMMASEAMRQNDEESDTDKNAEQSAFLNARGGGGPVSPQFWNSPSTSQY